MSEQKCLIKGCSKAPIVRFDLNERCIAATVCPEHVEAALYHWLHLGGEPVVVSMLPMDAYFPFSIEASEPA